MCTFIYILLSIDHAQRHARFSTNVFSKIQGLTEDMAIPSRHYMGEAVINEVRVAQCFVFFQLSMRW